MVFVGRCEPRASASVFKGVNAIPAHGTRLCAGVVPKRLRTAVPGIKCSQMDTGDLDHRTSHEPDPTGSGLFQISQHFSDAINRNVVESEILGGVHLRDVPPDTVLEVETQN